MFVTTLTKHHIWSLLYFYNSSKFPFHFRLENLYSFSFPGKATHPAHEIHLHVITLTSEQDRQITYNVILKRFLATIVCSGKEISIKYSECAFIALIIQHAMRKRLIVNCGLFCPTVFFHFFHNGDIKKKTLLNIKCIF